MGRMKEKYTQEKFDALWAEMEALDKVYEYNGIGNPQEAAAKQVGKSTRPNVPHYKVGAIEPIDFINSQDLNFNLGNAIKYVTRCNYKGTKKADLLKAIDYINFELENLTNE